MVEITELQDVWPTPGMAEYICLVLATLLSKFLLSGIGCLRVYTLSWNSFRALLTCPPPINSAFSYIKLDNSFWYLLFLQTDDFLYENSESNVAPILFIYPHQSPITNHPN